MLTQNMRPKFNVDTFYVPVHEGVYLRSNNKGLILKGQSLYRLLEYLVPYLDGHTTLEEITDGLDAARTQMITRLIEKLFVHHFLKDTSQDQHHTLSPVVSKTYSSNITFIESFQTSAASRFEHFRNQQLLIIGSGPGFASLVQACLQCGVRRTDIITTSESEISSNFHPDMLNRFSMHDSEQTVQSVDAPHWDNESEILNAIQDYDTILHIADRPILACAQLLNRLCIEQRKTFIQAIVVDDHAWVGPLVSSETAGCWECAWRRLQSNLPHPSKQLAYYELFDHQTLSSSRFLSMPKATIIANRLIFELFQYITQITPTGDIAAANNLIDIDLATGLSKRHSFLPHPHCLSHQHPVTPTASQFLEQIQQLQSQQPVNLDTFFEHMTRCVDERLGIFTRCDNDNFTQAPLAVYKVNIANPMLIKHLSEPLNVVAVSTDTENARLRAFLNACERYAANLVNRQRLLTSEAVQQHTLPTISTHQLIGANPFCADSETWTWALDLHTQQAYLVSATHVFAALHHQNQKRETGHTRGIASGMTWEEALCLALLDWCNYLTITELQDTYHVYTQVDLVRTEMTSEGVYLHHLLKTAGEQITIYDVTGILQVPTFATCLGEKVIAYNTHCDVAQALRMGLTQALQQYQSIQSQQPEYAVTPAPDLPLNLRSDQLQVPHSIQLATWSARLEWLLHNFQTNKLRAFAIPLDHDPALMQALPYVVRVLLSRT